MRTALSLLALWAVGRSAILEPFEVAVVCPGEFVERAELVVFEPGVLQQFVRDDNDTVAQFVRQGLERDPCARIQVGI